MYTTHTIKTIEQAISWLRTAVLAATNKSLRRDVRKSDLMEHADWLYAELMSRGLTPAQIAAAVPGVEVFA